MTATTLTEALQKLTKIEDAVHYEVYKHTERTGTLFETTFGLCDFMTAWTLKHFESDKCEAINFVGIDIPRREIKGYQTHSSHTVGILYDFVDGDEEVIWFDFACAQYDIDQRSLVQVVERDLLYHKLRETYGGGIWEPGGSWLSQLDVDTFGEYMKGLKVIPIED